jgi:hypothetical protein
MLSKIPVRYAYISVLFAVAVIVGVPFEAMATPAVDLTTQSKQLATQSANMPKLIAVAAYVIGSYFAYRGLLSLRGYIAEPDKNPLPQALGFLVVSALLISLPYTVGVFRNTMGAKNVGIKDMSERYQDEGIADPSSKDFHDTQYNIVKNAYQIPKFVAVLAYVCGTFFAATGLLKLKDWINDGDRNPLNPALFRLITAALLIAFPHILLVVTSVFFAHGNNNSVMVDVTTKMGKLGSFQKIN